MRARSQTPSIKELLEALADEERREASRSPVVVPLHRNHPREIMDRPGHQQGGGHATTGFVPVGSGAHVPRSAPRSPLLPLPDSRDLASIERHASDRIGQPFGLPTALHVAGLRLILMMAGLVVMLPSALYLAAPSLAPVASRETPQQTPTSRPGQHSIATASVTSVAIPVQRAASADPAGPTAPAHETVGAMTADQGRMAALTHARAALAAEPRAPALQEIPSSNRADEQTPRPYLATPQPAAQSALLVARGLALVEAGQLSAARMVFEQAGQSGSGQAALQAARLFDPVELSKRGIGREASDVAKARHWYERAATLGVAEARPLLARLPGS